MNVLVDVCLSERLAELLNGAGEQATSWVRIGAANAKDSEIMFWAKEHEHVVVSADLDFGDLLARTKDTLPSVILIRSSDQSPDHIAPLVKEAIERFREELRKGCLISVDEDNARMRLLPFG